MFSVIIQIGKHNFKWTLNITIIIMLLLINSYINFITNITVYNEIQ